MTRTLQDWSERTLAGEAIHERLDLRFGDCHITLRSNSRELLEKLAYYFKDFLTVGQSDSDIVITAIQGPPPAIELPLVAKTPDPGKHRVKEEWADVPGGRVVRKRLTGMVFFFGGGTHLALGPCVENHNQVINFVINRYMERLINEGHLLCHAAAVQHGGRGLALAGFSGMGKSTLALSMLSLGATFVSNDRLLVRRQGSEAHMLGVPKLPRINPGTVLGNPDLAPVMPPEKRAAAAALPPDDLWALEEKYDAFIDQCFGPGRFRLQGPASGLLLLNWTRKAPPETLRISRVDLAKRPDLMPAFTKSVGLFFDTKAEPPLCTDEAYLETLAPVPVFEATGGVSFAKAAEAGMAFLERGEGMTNDPEGT